MENSMQEVQTNKSEKLVPIDTSGEGVDIEINENKENVKTETISEDAPIVEVQEQNVSETKEEDLEEYSTGVKKRIDKLTKKMREAERREQAAIEYAKNVNDKYKTAVTLSSQKDDYSIKQIEEKLVTQEAFAKRALEAAIQAQDPTKQVEAQQEIARLAIEKERVVMSKNKRERQKQQEDGKGFQGEPMPVELQQGGQPEQTQQPVPVDPRAKAWAERNTWFGKDKVMTYAAMGVHEELVEEGFDAKSNEYYNEVDARIRQRFPQNEDKAKPTQKVASAVRTSSTGRRTVKLTPSQVAIAKKLGVPLEEYAKHVKEA
jgi:hypothetical protein